LNREGGRSAALALGAGWAWCGPGRLLRDAWVVVRDGAIEAVDHRPPAGAQARKLGPGLLMPGLVNAHTHLELSFLMGQVPPPAGDFVDWVTGLVNSRPGYDREQAKAAALSAARQAAATGTALAGDISNTGRAAWAWQEARVGAVTFIEAVGPARSQPAPPELIWQGGVLVGRGVAAHAPYSVPAERIQELKTLAQGSPLPWVIHCAESRAEVEMFAGSGPEGARMREFLAQRGVNLEELGMAAPTPLGHLMALGVVDARTLLVHGVQLTHSEILEIARAGASLCLCPRSNLGLTGQLANAPALMAAGVNLALGTDSLASCPDLDLWEEMRALMRAWPGLTPEQVITMATQGGAKALGLENHFGSIAPGRRAALCYAEVGGAKEGQVLAAAVAAGGAAAGRA